MANVHIDYENLLVHMIADEALSAEDFRVLEDAMRPVLETSGPLNGLIIEMERFPGWKNLAAFGRHIRFVLEHHGCARRIAFVTDESLASLTEKLGDHLVDAEVRRFPSADSVAAHRWIVEEQTPIVC